MATTGVLVSKAEYLKTVYEPDCEYDDGELIERNVGELPHGFLQGILYAYFLRRQKKWGITPLIEQRIQIRDTKFMIPDICVLKGPKPTVRILTEPPLIWIEILSSEDRTIPVNRKIGELIEFGAGYVWVIDADTLESFVITKSADYELTDGVFRIADMGIEVSLGALEED